MPRNLHCPFSDVYESCQKKFPQAKNRSVNVDQLLFPFPEEVFLRGRRAVTTAAGNARRRSAVSDVRPKTNQF